MWFFIVLKARSSARVRFQLASLSSLLEKEEERRVEEEVERRVRKKRGD